MPIPLESNSFDEIHAYHVLEHIGEQGDYERFFAEFTEYHRLLKPGGLFCGFVPEWNNEWAWGDPGHRRIITGGTLKFLSQREYEAQVGKTAMTDYRDIYRADFETVYSQSGGGEYGFVIKAIK